MLKPSHSRAVTSVVLLAFAVLTLCIGVASEVNAQISVSAAVTCPVFFPTSSTSGGLRVTVNAPADIQDYLATIDISKAASFDPPKNNEQLVLRKTIFLSEQEQGPVTIENSGNEASPSWLKITPGSPIIATAIGKNPFTANRFFNDSSHARYNRLFLYESYDDEGLRANVFVYQLSPAEFIIYVVHLTRDPEGNPDDTKYRVVNLSHHKLLLDEIEEFDDFVAVKTERTKSYTLASLPSGALLSDVAPPAAVQTINVPVWKCLDPAVTLYEGEFENFGGWKVIGATPGDRLNCSGNQANTGTCAFQFTGSSDENVRLTRAIVYSTLNADKRKMFDSNDRLELSAYVKAMNSASRLRMSMNISYTVGKNEVINKLVSGKTTNSDYVPIKVSLPVGTRTISQIKIQFRHTSQVGKVYLDNIQLALKNIPDAASATTGAADLIPLPAGPTE